MFDVSKGFYKILRYWLIPVLFFGLVAAFVPNRHLFEISTDEGINLIKALLLDRGFPLYDQVWSDQPPLFTQMLAVSFRIFGYKVESLRLLVTFLSALLLLGAYWFLDVSFGPRRAALGTILIVLMPVYVILSVSIMVGLPSITFAMLSLALLAEWHRHGRLWALIASASMLGISILIKLFTGILAPVFFLGILLNTEVPSGERLPLSNRLRIPLVWGGILLVFTAAGALLLVGLDNLPQLITNHLSSTSSEAFLTGEEFTLGYHLQGSYPIIFLALISAILSFRRTNRLWVYPFGWLVSAFALLSFVRPVWYHHQILITIPAAMLGSDAVLAGARWFFRLVQQVRDHWTVKDLFPLGTVLGLGLFFLSIKPLDPLQYLGLQSGEGTQVENEASASALLESVLAYAPETHWMLTDRPMYAFRAGLLVPPEIAVFSLKRVETNEIDGADLAGLFQAYEPEQILFTRYDTAQFNLSIPQNYRRVPTPDPDISYYIRDDIDRP